MKFDSGRPPSRPHKLFPHKREHGSTRQAKARTQSNDRHDRSASWFSVNRRNTIRVGEHVIHEIHGYNPAAVYVRRLSGKTEGLSISEIIISVVGDGYAQEELNAENAEAVRYPLGPKEYWRGRMVGKYTYGADGHLMTNEDFEADWAE